MSGLLKTALSFPVLLILLVLVVASPAEVYGQNQDTGVLSGVVREKDTGKPIAFADIVLQGSGRGGISQNNGTFTIPNLPAGTYTIIVNRIGYTSETIEAVTIGSGQVATISVSLGVSETQTGVVEVFDDRDKVDVTATDSKYKIDKDEFKIRAINNVTDALSKQPGVVVDPGGGIHLRGGRANETKFEVDGMPVSSSFNSGRSLSVSFAALDNIELLSGGFDAEYGNASSGIVKITTAEGGRNYSGLVRFFTDDYGADDKTYFNSDDIAFAIGGPLVSQDLRFHASLEGIWTDTYLPPNREYTKKEFLGIDFRDRHDNTYQGQGKLTYYFTPEKKISASALTTRRTWSPYSHVFSRNGWWSEERREWWFEPIDGDTTFEFFSGPEHYKKIERLDWQGSLHWTHTLSAETYYTARIANFSSERLDRVGGKKPEDYIPFFGAENEVDPLNRFYAVTGDHPYYERYKENTTTFKSSITSQVNSANRFKTGVHLDYHDIDNFQAEFPDSNNPQGRFPDAYHVYSWGGAAFIQNKFQYEGMVLNAGLRWDFFDPGLKAARLDNQSRASRFLPPNDISLNDRMKSQVSPRLGMAYPITDRDVLHFHYGRFYQLPSLSNLYESLGQSNTVPGGTQGNLGLQPTKNISYELGVDHQLTRTLNLDMTIFFKDIFGWIDTEEDVNGTLASIGADPAVTYVNQAYGTVKGLEFKLNKRFTGKMGGTLVYTLSSATGTHSDENTEVLVGSGQLNRKPLTENPLNWDRTHSFVGNVTFSDPGVWEISADYTYQSAAPYTPRRFAQRVTLAGDINTGRLEDEAWLDIRANKLYKMYGQEFRLYVEGTNLFDRENIAAFGPGVWPSNPGLYAEYYTEAGELGGAFNLNEVNSSSEQQYIPLSDPRVVDPPRQIKVGIMFDW